jgi:hypothetical protein
MALTDTKVVGSAGEHFVCSVLAQLGWVAALTREGVSHADVLAVYGQAPRRMIELQVKTISWNRVPKWPMGGRWMAPAASEGDWYVFVLLGGNERERPRCFVVPRDHATAGAYVGHETWRTDPSVPPGKRNTPVLRVRAGLDLWESYEERWDLLHDGTSSVPVLLPGWVRANIDQPRIAFPPDWHPWSRGIPAFVADDA